MSLIFQDTFANWVYILNYPYIIFLKNPVKTQELNVHQAFEELLLLLNLSIIIALCDLPPQ